MSFKAEAFAKNLLALDNTQATITGCSKYIQYNAVNISAMSEVFDAVFAASSEATQLAMIYVINDVVQASRKQHGDRFLVGFLESVRRALAILSSKGSSVLAKAARVVGIWRDRNLVTSSQHDSLQKAIDEPEEVIGQGDDSQSLMLAAGPAPVTVTNAASQFNEHHDNFHQHSGGVHAGVQPALDLARPPSPLSILEREVMGPEGASASGNAAYTTREAVQVDELMGTCQNRMKGVEQAEIAEGLSSETVVGAAAAAARAFVVEDLIGAGVGDKQTLNAQSMTFNPSEYLDNVRKHLQSMRNEKRLRDELIASIEQLQQVEESAADVDAQTIEAAQARLTAVRTSRRALQRRRDAAQAAVTAAAEAYARQSETADGDGAAAGGDNEDDGDSSSSDSPPSSPATASASGPAAPDGGDVHATLVPALSSASASSVPGEEEGEVAAGHGTSSGRSDRSDRHTSSSSSSSRHKHSSSSSSSSSRSGSGSKHSSSSSRRDRHDGDDERRHERSSGSSSSSSKRPRRSDDSGGSRGERTGASNTDNDDDGGRHAHRGGAGSGGNNANNSDDDDGIDTEMDLSQLLSSAVTGSHTSGADGGRGSVGRDHRAGKAVDASSSWKKWLKTADSPGSAASEGGGGGDNSQLLQGGHVETQDYGFDDNFFGPLQPQMQMMPPPLAAELQMQMAINVGMGMQAMQHAHAMQQQHMQQGQPPMHHFAQQPPPPVSQPALHRTIAQTANISHVHGSHDGAHDDFGAIHNPGAVKPTFYERVDRAGNGGFGAGYDNLAAQGHQPLGHHGLINAARGSAMVGGGLPPPSLQHGYAPAHPGQQMMMMHPPPGPGHGHGPHPHHAHQHQHQQPFQPARPSLQSKTAPGWGVS